MNILVVDDEKFNLTIAKNFINYFDDKCNVILCSIATDVMNIVKSFEIDIILLDIMMPELSGIDILEQIRSKKEYSNIQVIMLTALNDKENFRKCFELGADDYILKPIDLVEFGARLKAAIKTRRNSIFLSEMYAQIKAQNKELKELNQKLQDTQFHMIQKEKLASIGELAAGVAHEINNPIGFIGSNLETMNNFTHKIVNVIHAYKDFVQMTKPYAEQYPMLGEQIAQLEMIERKNKIEFVLNELDGINRDSREGIERISKIVQCLRVFARSGMEDERNYHNFNNIIDEAILIVRNESKYSTDIHTDYQELPDIYCNRGQIGQVILNLLVNAIQAIKSQERSARGKINIQTYLSDNMICCKIIDDGPGIKEDLLEKIFDPFFTTKDVGNGTGLGLSISHDIIVKKHNGVLLANSQLGKGAEFIIKLPQAHPDSLYGGDSNE